MRKKWIGALIGFAIGLYVASILSTNVFSEIYYFAPIYKVGLIFVNFMIIGGLCFLGIYLMPDMDDSIEGIKISA